LKFGPGILINRVNIAPMLHGYVINKCIFVEVWSKSATKTLSLMAIISLSQAFSYDVFLNFRGSDTRQGFTGYLHKALHDMGIHVFIDDEGIQSGKVITPELKVCLDELAVILETNPLLCEKKLYSSLLVVSYNTRYNLYT